MAKTRKTNASNDQADITLAKDRPKSLALAEHGVKTGADFADMMSALMSDIISGRITPIVANATVNAGGKLLKVVEMQYKYGGKVSDGQSLMLASGK